MDLDQLTDVISEFYYSACKKRISEDGEPDTSPEEHSHLKQNSSLKSSRAALNRYFKATFGVDIISSEKFIKANEIFQAVTKLRKQEGQGKTESKVTISDPDFSKLTSYFLKNM